MNKHAFISYSMEDREMFILSSIAKYLKESNYYVYTGLDIQVGSNWESAIAHEIKRCDLFIGIASHNGIKSKWVLKEWELAQIHNRTSIFLIEQGVNINSDFLLNNLVILFDRNNPNTSLLQLQQIVTQARENQKKNSQNLIIGGLIGMAIVKLLTDE